MQSATKSLPTITTSFPTTRTRREWAAPGETIIRTISRQHIGGVTERKDQRGWSDLRPISRLFCNQLTKTCFVSHALREVCASFPNTWLALYIAFTSNRNTRTCRREPSEVSPTRSPRDSRNSTRFSSLGRRRNWTGPVSCTRLFRGLIVPLLFRQAFEVLHGWQGFGTPVFDALHSR